MRTPREPRRGSREGEAPGLATLHVLRDTRARGSRQHCIYYRTYLLREPRGRGSWQHCIYYGTRPLVLVLGLSRCNSTVGPSGAAYVRARDSGKSLHSDTLQCGCTSGIYNYTIQELPLVFKQMFCLFKLFHAYGLRLPKQFPAPDCSRHYPQSVSCKRMFRFRCSSLT